MKVTDFNDQHGACSMIYNEDFIKEELISIARSLVEYSLKITDFAKVTIEIIKLNAAILERDSAKRLKVSTNRNAVRKRVLRFDNNDYRKRCRFSFNLQSEIKRLGQNHLEVCRMIKRFVKKVLYDRAHHGESFVNMNQTCALDDKLKVLSKIPTGNSIPVEVFSSLLKSLEGGGMFLTEFLSTFHLLDIVTDGDGLRGGFFVRETMKLNPTLSSVMNMHYLTLRILCGLVRLTQVPLDLDDNFRKELKDSKVHLKC
ncbi:hypothetical protein ACOME3_002768 [Neoechinorhynchus agilis]